MLANQNSLTSTGLDALESGQLFLNAPSVEGTVLIRMSPEDKERAEKTRLAVMIGVDRIEISREGGEDLQIASNIIPINGGSRQSVYALQHPVGKLVLQRPEEDRAAWEVAGNEDQVNDPEILEAFLNLVATHAKSRQRYGRHPVELGVGGPRMVT